MSLEDLSTEEVSDMIIEQYEKKYVEPRMNDEPDIRFMALLLLDARRLKDELHLAIAYAADWVRKNRPQGWQVVRNKLRYRRILTLPNQVKVMMLPPWERFTLLMSNPRYRMLASLEA